jgi:hypothetical protein
VRLRSQGIEKGTLPLAVYSVEVRADLPDAEEHLTVEKARQYLQFLRKIALDQDMLAQLEEGHISSPEEYIPLPETEA